MKKTLFMVLLSCAALAGCQAESQAKSEPVEVEASEEAKEEAAETEQSEVSDDADQEVAAADLSQEVEVTFRAYAMNGGTIEEYIDALHADDPDHEFSVYDENYYNKKLTEKERQEYIQDIESGAALDAAITTLKTDEVYGGAILDVKYDDVLQNFEILVDKEKYESNQFVCSLGASLALNVLSDGYQAYNLIAPEDRVTEIKIIDNANGQELE